MTANSEVENNTGNLDKLKWMAAFVVTAVAVGGNQFFSDIWVLYRVIAVVACFGCSLWLALHTDKGRQFIAFAYDAKTEVKKVIWPSRQEATNTTLIVFVVSCIFGVILWGVDSLLLLFVNYILGI
jgi:preprotein translocase subunit SecE